MIDDFVLSRPMKAVSFISLGQLRYLSTINYMDGVVGNSSSGLIEVPSFKVGTINIGDRQKGRERADSVIDCEPIEADISSAFQTLFSSAFQSSLKHTVNPYGKGETSKKIVNILVNQDLQHIVKKKFYDL